VLASSYSHSIGKISKKLKILNFEKSLFSRIYKKKCAFELAKLYTICLQYIDITELNKSSPGAFIFPIIDNFPHIFMG